MQHEDYDFHQEVARYASCLPNKLGGSILSWFCWVTDLVEVTIGFLIDMRQIFQNIIISLLFVLYQICICWHASRHWEGILLFYCLNYFLEYGRSFGHCFISDCRVCAEQDVLWCYTESSAVHAFQRETGECARYWNRNWPVVNDGSSVWGWQDHCLWSKTSVLSSTSRRPAKTIERILSTFFYRNVTAWNILPVEIKTFGLLAKFKSALKMISFAYFFEGQCMYKWNAHFTFSF